MCLRFFTLLIIFAYTLSSNAAVNITCKFVNDEGIYVAALNNQTYNTLDRLKIYGRHLNRMNNNNVQILDASNKGNGLEILPSILLQIFGGLQELRLEKCGLKKLTATSFRYCNNIIRMKFGGDEIDIEPDTFKMCRHLELLEFNSNKIESISSLAFKGLKNLKVLKIHDCQLFTIEPTLFLPLSSLEQLHFTKNKISDLPENALLNLENLKIMNFSSNEFTTFSSVHLKLKYYLESVDLSGNKIVSLERAIFEDWRNHAALNLSSNVCVDRNFTAIGTNEMPVTKVVEDLKNCFKKSNSSEETGSSESSLEEIFIGMTDSPFDFVKNTDTIISDFTTTTTEASTKKVTPKSSSERKESSMAKKSSKKEVPLHDNEQTNCRFFIDAEKNYNCILNDVTPYLKKINVDHFDGFTNLNVSGVFFRHSKLFQVPKTVVHTFPNIILLSIEKTNLKVMDEEFIEICGNIKSLNLMDNKIRRVEQKSLKNCESLEHVDLSGNPIETIESGIFGFNPNLTIKFNQLKIVH